MHNHQTHPAHTPRGKTLAVLSYLRLQLPGSEIDQHLAMPLLLLPAIPTGVCRWLHNPASGRSNLSEIVTH